MFGNRGIYHDGWVAAARHSIPWLMVPTPPLTADVWELYHTAEDFSQAHDLAAQNPAKLKELQDLFMKQAVANHVLPIDDRRSERFDAKIAGQARSDERPHVADGLSGHDGHDRERLHQRQERGLHDHGAGGAARREDQWSHHRPGRRASAAGRST